METKTAGLNDFVTHVAHLIPPGEVWHELAQELEAEGLQLIDFDAHLLQQAHKVK